MLPFARPSWAHLIPLLLALTLLPAVAPAQAPARADAATMTKSRWGTTPAGETRIVFQFDAPVDYFTSELSGGTGLDVHLPDASPASASAPLRIGNGVVAGVTYRPGPSGIVARIESAGGPLKVKTFVLKNPDRVVIDVTSDRSPKPKATSARDAAKPSPAPARKEYRTNEKRTEKPEQEVGKSEPKPAREIEKSEAEKPDAAEKTILEAPEATKPATGATEFQDLLGWIQRLRTQVEALNTAESDPERAKYRRQLAYILAERGILVEAERALDAALASPARVQASAFADSIYLAELRLRLGRNEAAAELARAIDVRRATPQEQVRIAAVLVDTDHTAVAGPILDEAIPGLSPAEQRSASLLRARCHWAQKDTEKAREIVDGLTSDPNTRGKVLASALVLHADCLWALGRPGDAKDLYERAAGQSLGEEEASWTMLQLGNLAHREGRIEDAKALYRKTMEQWPDSFYAPQADWFLRMTERTEKLGTREVAQSRG